MRVEKKQRLPYSVSLDAAFVYVEKSSCAPGRLELGGRPPTPLQKPNEESRESLILAFFYETRLSAYPVYKRICRAIAVHVLFMYVYTYLRICTDIWLINIYSSRPGTQRSSTVSLMFEGGFIWYGPAGNTAGSLLQIGSLFPSFPACFLFDFCYSRTSITGTRITRIPC